MNSATGPVYRQQTWGERVAVLERELASMQAERDDLQGDLATAQTMWADQKLLLHLASQNQAAWRKLVDSLRDRLRRCQEHNRQAHREVRQWEAASHRTAIAFTAEVAEYRTMFAQRAEQAEAERDAARAALGRTIMSLRNVCLSVHQRVHMASPCLEPDCNCLGCYTYYKTLADPLGQQATQEWRAVQAFVGSVRQLAASWSDMVGIPRDIKDLLAELDKARPEVQEDQG